MPKKRQYKKSQDNRCYKELDENKKNECIEFLKKTGVLKEDCFLSPFMINPELEKIYDEILEIREKISVNIPKILIIKNDNDVLKIFKLSKSELLKKEYFDKNRKDILEIFENKNKDYIKDYSRFIDLRNQFINLTSIIILAVIKRYKTMIKQHYTSLYKQGLIGVLRVINGEKEFDKSKNTMLSSFLYEIVRYDLLYYIQSEINYENNTVAFIFEDYSDE